MAGDWIKMRVDLREDPAVFRLAELLDRDELYVIGCLYAFWSWCDKHTVDGHVDGASSRLVDKVCATDGFASAMVQVGWLVISDSGIEIPHFERHNGESAKERGLKNARQARWRAKKGINVDGQASTDSSTAASTREEKRREENIGRFARPSGSEVSEYAQSIGFTLDGDSFCDHYDSKGWKVGKTPMRDWRAAVRTWKRSRTDQPATAGGEFVL